MKKVSLFFLGFIVTVSVGISLLSFFVSSKKAVVLSPSLMDVNPASASELGTSIPSPYVVYEALSLESIFSANRYKKTDEDVTIVATGDVIPARVTNSKIVAKGVDYPFAKIDSLLKGSDLSVINLESPLLKNCQTTVEGMSFCGAAGFAAAMKRHGVGLATLENNHIGNQGIQGITETKNQLAAQGIPFARYDQPFITTIKGEKFGFLPVNGVGIAIDRVLLASRISLLRPKVDVLIVCVHWGKEYTYDPVAAPGIAPDDPQEIAHIMIDSGADVVLGNHPHWVQGVELYKEGFISYAHGNFIFDQEWSQETKKGVVGSYTFAHGKLVAVHFTPIIIEDYSQPREATLEEGSAILDLMRQSSIRIGNR